MVTQLRRTGLLAAAVALSGFCFIAASPVHAQRIQYGNDYFEKSKDAPRNFVVSNRVKPMVWAKAQALVSTWKDKWKTSMKIQNATDNLIETYTPISKDMVGFRVNSVPTTDGFEITVDTMAFEGNAFNRTSERKDSAKRGHLLAYLLAEYAKEMEAAAPSGAEAAANAAPGAPPALRADLEAVLTSLRTLIAAKQYEAAAAQTQVLKAMLEKEKTPAAKP